LLQTEERGKPMAKGLDDIVAQLEQQAAAIERALAALREVEGTPAPATAAKSSAGPTKRTGGMTPAGRKRLSAALRKRWAAKREAQGTSTSSVAPRKAAARKVRITPEGRKRLADAMKRRWAVKRAASAVKSSGTKKRAAKKAA
jgi:hypothetical protein